MVFVSIGTQDKEFDRLIEYIKRLKKENILKDDLIIQSGITKVDFDNEKMDNEYNVEAFSFISSEKMKEYISKADYVIIHGGVGTIIQCIMQNKKIIVVPRLKKHFEHENDHQLEIANKFKNLKLIEVANDYDKLKNIILNIDNIEFEKYISTNDEFVAKLDEIIQDM